MLGRANRLVRNTLLRSHGGGGDARGASRSRLAGGLALHLRHAVEIPDRHGCLEEIVHSTDTFHAGRRVTVEAYDESRVSFLSAEHKVVPLVPLLDPDARRYAENPEKYIVNGDYTDASLEFRFFSDPALHEAKDLLRLIKTMNSRGIVGFHLYRKAIVGVFTVARKGGKLRMVCDGHGPNTFTINSQHRSYQQPPPSLTFVSTNCN